MKDIKVTATADANGKVDIHISSDKEVITIDLDYLLLTNLYKAGYPKTEDNRLKHRHEYCYDYSKDNSTVL